MILFLVVFLSLYSGIHLYAFLRLRSAYPVGRKSLAVIVGMTVTPLLIRLLEWAGFERSALYAAVPSYIWMGSIFLFVTFLFFFDVLRLLFRLILRKGSSTSPFLSASVTCKMALILALLASCYSLYEAQHIQTDHLTITSNRLTAGSRPVRIVQISDVHIGMLFRISRLANVLKEVRKAVPDMLISTGDLVDGRLSREDVIVHQNRLAAMIAAVPTPLGKFAVTGNHEFYSGIEQAQKFTEASGFKMLRNEALNLPDNITLVGIDDPARQIQDGAKAELRERSLLSLAPRTFKILLKHRPLLAAGSDGLFDLQLSGHTHKGQLLPFYPLTWIRFPIHSGTTRTANGSTIHVSRGTGTWGPPMRLFAPPEITIIDLIPQPRTAGQ